MNVWITLDVEIGRHPKMAALPSDSARYGWILALLEAKKQRHPGTFASTKHFRLVMGRHARYLKDYVAACLLDVGQDGTLAVHDWRRHQWVVAQQSRRHGDDAVMTLEGQEDDPHARRRAVSVPVSVLESTEGGPGETADTWTLYCGLTGAVRPSPNVTTWLTRLEDRYGGLPTVQSMKAEWDVDQERRTFLSRVEHRLEKAAREVEADAERAKREQRRNREVWQRRVETYRFTGKWEPEWGPVPEGSAA